MIFDFYCFAGGEVIITRFVIFFYKVLLFIFLHITPVAGTDSISCHKDDFIIFDDSLKNQSLHFKFIDSSEFYSYEYSVVVLNKIERDTLQVLRGEYNLNSGLAELKLEDVDFDGIEDLLVLIDISASGSNRDYDFWVYDTSINAYKYDSLLSSTISCNPGIDSYNKEYTTLMFSGCASQCWTIYTYKLINNSLQLVKEEIQSFVESSDNLTNEDIFKRTISELKDNRMVIVKESKGNLTELDKKRWE